MSNLLPNPRRLSRGLEAAWRSGLVPKPRLDVEALEAAALRGRPAEAFGPDLWWREPLGKLTEALRREANLNPLGKTMAYGQIVMALRSRMRASSLWDKTPEILATRVLPPIILLGQMRSGTTRLQRLLACDDRLAHTRLFESLLPVPKPARRFQTAAILSLLRRLNPEVNRIHPTQVSAPDEEFGLFSFSFGSAQFEAQWQVPSFSRWWEQAPTARLYEEFRALLQTIAWSRRSQKERRWVIKAPQFLQDLPTLLKAFPTADLLWLQRDPAEVVASSASLVWNQMRVQSDTVDPFWVGKEWLRKTGLRQIAVTGALNQASAPKAHAVGYEAMNRDWAVEIRKVYDHIGLDLTPEVERRMAHYVQNARSHRGHHYCLAQFGLSEAQVGSVFEQVDEIADMRAVVPPAA